MNSLGIDLERIEKLRTNSNKATGRCPACAEAGLDRTGNHFFLDLATGRFGCAANPQNPEHRKEIFALVGTKDTTAQDYPALRQSNHQRQAAAYHTAAACQHQQILRDYEWPLADAWEQSPIRPSDCIAQNWRAIVGLMPATGLIWLGEMHQSGPGHEARFRTRDEWLAAPSLPAPRMAPSIFSAGPSRCQTAVQQTSFVVVEADEAIGRKPIMDRDKDENRAASAAITRWLRERLGWHLRAIILTGNKSLHCWFDHPGAAAVQELALVASAWGIDAGLLQNPAAPLRLPGAIHEKTGTPATLLYLNPSPAC